MEWLRKAAVGATALGAVRYAVRAYRRVDVTGRSVVITGGSRGLGLELAREFASRGARLALLARNEDELSRAADELSGADVITIRCDVRDRGSVEAGIERVMQERGAVDILVNVAGIIDVGPIDHLTEEDFADSLATHFWGPLYTIRSAVKHMHPGGRIVNISSIAGLVAVPHLSSYTAGKFALTGLSEGLHAELSGRDIIVTTVCPGLMRTGSHVKARFKGRHEKEFAWFAVNAGFPLASMKARRAARQIVEACRLGQPFLILTPQARALHLFHALAPNTTARLMRIVDRLLPEPTSADGQRKREGWQAKSDVAPSALTHLADRNIPKNNELDGAQQRAYEGSAGEGDPHAREGDAERA